jgi:hypothetical protein
MLPLLFVSRCKRGASRLSRQYQLIQPEYPSSEMNGARMMDHGYEVNEDKRCEAMTKKERRCSMPPISGIERCALHAGLARPRGHAAYGDPKALEQYKRKLGAEATNGRGRGGRLR